MKKRVLTPAQLQAYADHMSNNGVEILHSEHAACCFCLSTFEAKDVHDWDDTSALTALCPSCGMPSVVGDASKLDLDPKILEEVRDEHFSDEALLASPDVVLRYCDRYLMGKVTVTEANEKLFLHYAKIMAEHGHEGLALFLGTFYTYGGRFVGPDWPKAMDWFHRPGLSTNPDALVGQGRILAHLAEHENIKKDEYFETQAYQCFSAAAALGSYTGLFLLAGCYFDGTGTRKDPKMGYEILLRSFPDVLSAFSKDESNREDFINYSLRFADCYQKGIGTEKDESMALRYLLYADLGIRSGKLTPFDPELNQGLANNVKRRIRRLAKKLQFTKAEPVYDQDTFYDSFCDEAAIDIPKWFHLVSFDKDTGILKISTRHIISPIIVDLASLYCEFGPMEIDWEFHDIDEFRSDGDEVLYDRIIGGGGDNAWTFLRGTDPTKAGSEAAYLRFRDDSKDEEGSSDKGGHQ